jgi:hypothetical protein
MWMRAFLMEKGETYKITYKITYKTRLIWYTMSKGDETIAL